MGFNDELDKRDVRAKAVRVIKLCGDMQYEDPNDESIAMVAKIWCDIYKEMEIKEARI